MKYLIFFLFAPLLFLFSCRENSEKKPLQNTEKELVSAMDRISKPYARYWWFASEIKREDIKFNLDWLKSKGFGGVEIAWVYPLNRMNPVDTSFTPRQPWLSPRWQEMVRYAISYADSIGLGCDLTFGTLWPFGDSYVPRSRASRRFGDNEFRQKITASWEHPKQGYVVDHLKKEHYLPYFQRIIDSFPKVETQIPQACFVDSWEVETQKLWTEGFGKEFQARFGYKIEPFMDSIYAKNNSARLYDYMSLISEKVIGFYHHFDSVLNQHGFLSRGQCSGAPCDIISAYATLDIPEGEAMLYEPEYNAIPASAAALAGKKVVSAETFTCLYGWPRDYMRQEQTADLKLIADALFANGINHIVWHGKAHNPNGLDTVNFYATVHVGKQGALNKQLEDFNHYLSHISEYMKKGKTYSQIAAYLPTEDAWRAGIMPKSKQFRWAWGFYEMRYVYFPPELKGFRPLWINGDFLEKARVENGRLLTENQNFEALYLNSHFIDYQSLKHIARLAQNGLPVVMKQKPKPAGAQKPADWEKLLNQIKQSENFSENFEAKQKPLLQGETIPAFWARQTPQALYLFLAQPKSQNLKFPVKYGQALCKETQTFDLKINYKKHVFDLKARFEPYQSLLYKISENGIEKIDIGFVPETPVKKQRPTGYKAPWLVR